MLSSKKRFGFAAILAILIALNFIPSVKAQRNAVLLDFSRTFALSFGDLRGAVQSYGTREATIRVNTPQNLNTNLTIPSNITLIMECGFTTCGSINPASGVTATIEGPFHAPEQKVFGGVGTIAFGTSSKVTKVLASWFGVSTTENGANNKTYLQAAIDAAVSASGKRLVLAESGLFPLNTGISLRTGVTLKGHGYATVFQIPNSHNTQDNLLKAESVSNVHISGLRVDGNRVNQTQTNYGVFFGGCTDCKVDHVYANNFSGDGIHIYNSDRPIVTHNSATNNFFHGIEMEQVRGGLVSNNVSFANLRHGIFIYEGEVAATGTIGLIVSSNDFSGNSQYGLAVQGPLTHNVTIIGNIMRDNLQYGATIFDTGDNITFSKNQIYNNQFHGLYVFRSNYISIEDNHLRNNSQAGNGLYTEILIDGDATKRPSNVKVLDNTVRITGAIKSAYAVKENTSLDGPNDIRGNTVDTGTVDSIAVLHTGTQASSNTGYVTENKGTLTGSGNGVNTLFVFNHGLHTTPISVNVSPGHTDAKGEFYTTVDSTNIAVTYTTAPITGTGNVILFWSAETLN